MRMGKFDEITVGVRTDPMRAREGAQIGFGSLCFIREGGVVDSCCYLLLLPIIPFRGELTVYRRFADNSPLLAQLVTWAASSI